MAWFIASVPFWIMGLVWFVMGIYNLFSPEKLTKTQIEHVMGCLFCGGMLWIVAAILC